MTHSIHKEGDILQIYFDAIFWETRHHAVPRHIWRTNTLCPFFGRQKNTCSSAVRLIISLATVCYGDFCWGLLLLLLLCLFFFLLKIDFNIASLSTWFQVSVSNQNFTDGFLLKFFFFFVATARYPQSYALFRLLCMTGYSCINVIPVRCVFYSDSKTDLKLWCDYCIEFQLFEGAQDVITRFTAERCLLLPQNPYRLPQHYKRHVCGPSCSCKHWFFLDISYFWALVLSELYGYSTPVTTFLVNN